MVLFNVCKGLLQSLGLRHSRHTRGLVHVKQVWLITGIDLNNANDKVLVQTVRSNEMHTKMAIYAQELPRARSELQMRSAEVADFRAWRIGLTLDSTLYM